MLKTNILLFFYRSDSNAKGRSPLDLPARGMLFAFLGSLLMAVMIGNLTVRGLFRWGQKKLEKDEVRLAERAADPSARAGEWLSMPAPKKALPEPLQKLFGSSSVDWLAFEGWIRGEKSQISLAETRACALGELRGWLFPLYWPSDIEAFLRDKSFQKPDPSKLAKLDDDDLAYQTAYHGFVRFGERAKASYREPLRLAAALGGAIQWLTFVLAIFGGWLLALRLGWTSLQKRLILEGKLPEIGLDAGNVWDVQTASVQQAQPVFFTLQERFPTLFLAPDLIAEAVRGGATGKTMSEFYGFIADKVAERRAKVESGEYEIIDFSIYSAPTLGFLGTILGITEAFGRSEKLISSDSMIGRMQAFGGVTEALALAFDTSFVGLLAVFILQAMLSLSRRSEARLFALLEREAKVRLHVFWQSKN